MLYKPELAQDANSGKAAIIALTVMLPTFPRANSRPSLRILPRKVPVRYEGRYGLACGVDAIPFLSPRPFGYLKAAGGLLMITSTRRFCCRPAAESLPATGSLSPFPNAESRIAPIPCPARYAFTESARRSDSPWL